MRTVFDRLVTTNEEDSQMTEQNQTAPAFTMSIEEIISIMRHAIDLGERNRKLTEEIAEIRKEYQYVVNQLVSSKGEE